MATRRRESMVLLAGALGIEVRAGEPTGELMGRCIERAEELSTLISDDGARGLVGFDVSPMPKPGEKGSTSRKSGGNRKGSKRGGRSAEQVAA